MFQRQRSLMGRFDVLPLRKEDILRKIAHFGGDEEYKVYANLIHILPESKSDWLKKLKDDLVKKYFRNRIQMRANDSLREVIEFRVQFEFARFDQFEQAFLDQVNQVIIQSLINSTNSLNLKELLECLSDKSVRQNQDLLSFYVNELLLAKWPKTTASNFHDQLVFALEWPLFVPLYEMHRQATTKSGQCQLLHSQVWFNRYVELLNYFRKCVSNLRETNEEKLKTVKLLNKNLDSACALFE